MEFWKDIQGFEGIYQVSNLGRVRSLDRFISCDNKMWLKKGKIMSQHTHSIGYKRISLHKNSVKHKLLVHRIVATAFISNPDNKPDINHIDGNPQNNYVGNLEWITESENTQHAYNLGLMKPRSGINNPMAKLTLRDIEIIKMLYCNKRLSQRNIARQFGVSNTTIGKVINNISYQ